MNLDIKLHTFAFRPADRTAELEIQHVMGVWRGLWIMGMYLQGNQTFSDGTSLEIGDTDDPVGYSGHLGAFGTIFYQCAGTYLLPTSSPKVYGTTAHPIGTITAIDYRYGGDAGATEGALTVYVIYTTLEP